MPRAPRIRAVAAALVPDPFLCWLLAWVYWGVRPRLIYLAAGPVFSLAPEFAPPFFHQCGGLARYGGAFLAQFDYCNLAGAAVRVVEALLIGRLAELVAARALGRPVRVLRYVALLPYFLLCGRVDQNPAAALMVIGTLAAAWAGATTSIPQRAWRWALHVALTIPVAGALAGAAGRDGLWVTLAGFGVMAALAERRRAGEMKLRWLVAYVAAPLVAAWVSGRFLPPRGELPPDAPTLLTHALTLLFLAATPLVVLLLTLWPAAATLPAWMERRSARALAMVGGLLLVGALSADLCAAQPAWEQAEWDNLVLDGRWDEVLARYAAEPSRSVLAVHDVDTALGHLGGLADRMFFYPQEMDTVLLSMSPPYTVAYRCRLADQDLELGRVNLAEFALHDSLLHTGDNPYVLGRLARVYLIKGDLRAARLYLTALSYDVIHGAWARQWLRTLAADPTLEGQPEILASRANMMSRDDLLDISNQGEGSDKVSSYPLVAMADLLDSNPHNRAALDELMALYLLAGHPEGVARELHRVVACGLHTLPAPWEEALLIVLDQPHGTVDLGTLTISSESRQRWRSYKQVMRTYRNDPRAAWPEVSRDFAGTYLAYITSMRSHP